MTAVSKTIAAVRAPREWEGQYGPMVSIDVVFRDGDEGGVNAKPNNGDKIFAALEALVDKESSFDLESKPEYNGITQWKIKDYPGKVQYQGGTGGRGPGDWETSQEREFRNKLIAMENACLHATALACVSKDLETSMDKLAFVETATPRIYKVYEDATGPYPAKTPEAAKPETTE